MLAVVIGRPADHVMRIIAWIIPLDFSSKLCTFAAKMKFADWLRGLRTADETKDSGR